MSVLPFRPATDEDDNALDEAIALEEAYREWAREADARDWDRRFALADLIPDPDPEALIDAVDPKYRPEDV
jgi:hypothetical protein